MPSNDVVNRLLAPALRKYNAELRQHGASAAGVLWRSEQSLERRLRVLSRILPSRGTASIHDFGCGYGALFDFLADHPVLADGGCYLGTDMSDEMLAAARQRVDDSRARFAVGVHASVVADYTFASGTFNLRAGVCEAEWTSYVENTLRTLWAHTRRGLAFNLLHDANPRLAGGDAELLFYADARHFHSFARDLAPSVELIVPPTRAGLVAAFGPIVGAPASAIFIAETGRSAATGGADSHVAAARRAVLRLAGVRIDAALPPTDVALLLRR